MKLCTSRKQKRRFDLARSAIVSFAAKPVVDLVEFIHSAGQELMQYRCQPIEVCDVNKKIVVTDSNYPGFL